MRKVFVLLLLLIGILSSHTTVSAVDTFSLKMKTGNWVEFANQPLPDDGVFLLEEGHIEKFEKLDVYGKSAEIYGLAANFFGDPNVLAENGMRLEVMSDGNLFFTNGDEIVQFEPVEDLEGRVFKLEYVSPSPEDRKELIYLTASDSFIHLVKYVKEGDKEFMSLNSFTENLDAIKLTTSLSSEEEAEQIAVTQELTDFKNWYEFGNITLSINTEKASQEALAYKSIVNFVDAEIDDDFIKYYEEYFGSEDGKDWFIESYVVNGQNKERYLLGATEEDGFYDKSEGKDIRSILVPIRTNYEDVFVLDHDGNRLVYIKKDKELYVIRNKSENEVFVIQFLLEDDERFSQDFIVEHTAASEDLVEGIKDQSQAEPQKEQKTESKPKKKATSEFYNNDNIAEDIYPSIVAIVKQAVAQNEGISGAKFPWGYDDYNINSLGDDMYNTRGQFTYDGHTYTFELIIFMRPDTSGRVEFYNVY